MDDELQTVFKGTYPFVNLSQVQKNLLIEEVIVFDAKVLLAA